MRSGRPLPLTKRAWRSTSKLREVSGRKSSIRQILAVVPPMSNDSTRSSPHSAAIRAARIAPPAGPGFDQADRLADRMRDRHQPAARGHQEQRAAQPGAGEALLELLQVAGDPRLDVGVGGGGREALVLADLGADLARQREPEVRQRGAQDLGAALLVGRVGVAVQKADRDALDPERRRAPAPAPRPRPRRAAPAPAPSAVDPLGHGAAGAGAAPGAGS